MRRNNKTIKYYESLLFVLIPLILTLIFGVAKVYGESMMPNFSDGQLIIYNKIVKNYQRFDIILVEIYGEIYIKRIIGLPGEKVSYKKNRLFINDVEVAEKYIRTETNDFNMDFDVISEKSKMGFIPKKQYLVLGDNRSFSYDSRNFGLISLSDIKGRVITTR